MELLKETSMADGRSLRIYRQITPDKEPVPERLIRYMISSIGFDSYRKFVHDQNYWRLYYRAALTEKEQWIIFTWLKWTALSPPGSGLPIPPRPVSATSETFTRNPPSAVWV